MGFGGHPRAIRNRWDRGEVPNYTLDLPPGLHGIEEQGRCVECGRPCHVEDQKGRRWHPACWLSTDPDWSPQIARAPMRPIEVVLEALRVRGLKVKKVASGWTAQCPSHEDRTPSLSISEAPDGTVGLNCHAGCNTEGEVMKALDLPMSALFPPKNSGNDRPEIVTYHVYPDEDESPLYRTVRMFPKKFFQEHLNAKGEWVTGLEGVRRVLYNLPKVKAERELVYVVEGEKDADSLTGLAMSPPPIRWELGSGARNTTFRLPTSSK